MNSSSGLSRLGDGRGLRFAERANPDARKRPVREVVGFDPHGTKGGPPGEPPSWSASVSWPQTSTAPMDVRRRRPSRRS